MRDRPTISDVARVAQVAVSTASDALNDKGRVSPATKARVKAVAVQLNYKPAPLARGLVTGRTMAIGVRVGRGPAIPQAHFFVDLLNGAASAAARHGYGLMITTSTLEEPALVDALIAVDPLDHAELEGSLQAGLPIITVGRIPSRDLAIPTVDIDHVDAMAMLLDHLAEGSGRSGPMWLLSLERHPSFVSDIEEGCARWCRANDREFLVLACPDHAEGTSAVIEAALGRHPAPAIVASVLDRQAAWGQRALIGAGFSVPGDVTIGSSAEGDLLQLAVPSITTLDTVGRAHGEAAVALAIRAIEAPDDPPESVLLPAKLIVRGSSRR